MAPFSSLVTSCNLVTGAIHHLLLTTHHFNQLLTKKEYLRPMKKTGRSSAGRTGSSSKSGRKGSFSKDSGGKSGGKRAYGASSGSEKPRYSRSAEEVPVARKHQDHSMKNQNELIHRVMKTGQLLKMDRNVHTIEVKVAVNVQGHPVMVTDQNVHQE